MGEISGGVVAGTLSSLLVSLFAFIALRILVPRWIAGREQFEVRIEERVGRIENQVSNGDSALRSYIDIENRKIVDMWHSENEKLRSLWHAFADNVNRPLGDLNGSSRRHDRDIEMLTSDVKSLVAEVHNIDKSCSAMSGQVEGLTFAVKALTAAVEGMSRP